MKQIERQVKNIQCYYCEKECEEWMEDSPDGDEDYLKCEHCNIGSGFYDCDGCEYEIECEDYNTKIEQEYFESCIIGCGYNSVEEFWEHSI